MQHKEQTTFTTRLAWVVAFLMPLLITYVHAAYGQASIILVGILCVVWSKSGLHLWQFGRGMTSTIVGCLVSTAGLAGAVLASAILYGKITL